MDGANKNSNIAKLIPPIDNRIFLNVPVPLLFPLFFLIFVPFFLSSFYGFLAKYNFLRDLSLVIQCGTVLTLFEKIIPPKERHNLGQYYTPPEVVELITRLTIKKS